MCGDVDLYGLSHSIKVKLHQELTMATKVEGVRLYIYT